MTLTVAKIRDLSPEDGKAKRLSDANGLFIEALPTGTKIFRMAYRIKGKQKSLTFGQFPLISLAEARTMRDEARRHLAFGRDPAEVKKGIDGAGRTAASRTFKAVSEEWLAKRRKENRAPATIEKDEWLISSVLPAIGEMDIAEIRPRHLIDCLQPFADAGRLTKVNDARSRLSRIFRYAVAKEYREINPAASISDALPRPKKRHHAAALTEKDARKVIAAIWSSQATPHVRLALRAGVHMFVRSGEIRQMQWKHVDMEARMISLDAEIMKIKDASAVHLVPISDHLAAILEEAGNAFGREGYVFPSPLKKGRPLSENTLRAAMIAAGIDHREDSAFHGLRRTASTLLNEVGWHPDHVDKQLAHERAGVSGAYNSALYILFRVPMMTAWSEFVEGGKLVGPVV